MVIPSLVMWGSVIISLLWVAIFVFIGFRARKNVKTIEHFLIYGKDMTKDELRWTFYCTNISLASIFIAIALTTSTKDTGLCAIWLIIAWVCGMWCFLKFYKTKDIQNFFRNNGRTMFQYMGNFYGDLRLRKVGAGISIFIYVASVGAEFFAFVEILRFLGLPDIYVLPSCIFLTVLTVYYASIGGFCSVIKTEFWQYLCTSIGSICIAVMVILGFTQVHNKGIIQFPSLFDTRIWGAPLGIFSNPTFIIGSFLLFLTFMISTMDAWQRCAAISEHQNAVEEISDVIKKGSFVFPFFYGLPLLCGVLFLLLSTQTSPGPTSSAAPLLHPLVTALSQCHISWQIFLFGFAFSAFVAAMISTADTLLVSAVYALFYDILGIRQDGFDMSQIDFSKDEYMIHNKRLILNAKASLMILGTASLITTIVGVYLISFTAIIWTLFSSLIIFSVPLLFAVIFPKIASKKNISAYTSIISGFSIIFILIIWYYFKGSNVLEESLPLLPILGFFVSVLVFLCMLPFNSKK